jgi:hypothetical protein
MPSGIYEHPKRGLWNMRRYDPVTGCWNCTAGASGRGGYKLIWYRGKFVLAHRFAAHVWLRFDLNSKLNVLHKCDNPACFNPKHLFIGTQKDNIADAIRKGRLNQIYWQATKTHCPQGHLYSGSNLAIHRTTSGGQTRVCKRCQLLRTWKRRGKVVPIG